MSGHTPIPEAYRSKSIEQAIAHLAEELAEALQAAAKSLRFGPTSVNPELPPKDQETNIVWLRREMRDVARAYAALDELCAQNGHLDPGELVSDLGAAIARATTAPETDT